MSMTIAILGASGHVGQRIVRRLLASPAEVVERVITLDRRVVDGFPAEDRLCNHVVDMGCADALQCAAAPLLAGVDVVVATMGVGSGFGSIAEFRRVEVALPAAFARAAAGAGVKRAVLLTAAGADVDRGFSFLLPHVARGQYFHLKGLVEQHFADAGFAEGVVVFRPGGLLGTTHLPEWIDAVLVRVDWMWPVHFRCIHIAQLADAMARAAIGPAPGEHGATTVVQGEGLFDLLRADRRAACVAD